MSDGLWKKHLQTLRFSSQKQTSYVQAISTLEGIVERAVELQELGSNEKVKLRLANKTFWERVGCFQGGISFLLSLGFQMESDGNLDFALVIDPRNINVEEYWEVLTQLKSISNKHFGATANEVRKRNIGDIDQKPLRVCRGEKQGSVAFDPFKASFTSTNPDSDAIKENADGRIEKQLETLKAKKNKIESGTIERNIMIFSPNARSSLHEKNDQNNHTIQSSPTNVLLEDMKARTKKNPMFKTRLQRELEAIKSEPLYSFILVRVSFPDGVQIQARFKPLEKISDIEETLQRLLESEGQYLKLYKVPPKTILDSNMTLQEAGLFPPAVRLFVEWKVNMNSKTKSTEELLLSVHERSGKQLIMRDKHENDFPNRIEL